MKTDSTIEEARAALRDRASEGRAADLSRYFKTAPGEYGEGDAFLGIRVPDVRKVARNFPCLGEGMLKSLLGSRMHEERLLALLIMVLQFQNGDDRDRERIHRLYLSRTRFVNNWDLVDLSAPHIVGAYLTGRDRSVLETLAGSRSLWERRIAIVSTLFFIRDNDFDTTFRIAERLLSDRHDLIHKAVGWMLREVGKRDRAREERFLRPNYRNMPRTMLRYAIERFPEPLRQAYLKGTVRGD